MKKYIQCICTAIAILSITSITAFAQEDGISSVAKTLFGCIPVTVVFAISVVITILIAVLRKKIEAKLRTVGATEMIHAFIAFFAFNGIMCLILALITDGETWTHMMHTPEISGYNNSQFWEFIRPIQLIGGKDFSTFASRISPLSTLLYFFISKLTPKYYIDNNSVATYPFLLKIQAYIFIYLIFIMICLCFAYRMNRYKLRKNGRTFRNDIVSFLLVFSFPMIYCVELGNIVILSYLFLMPYILYRNDENKRIRLAAIASLGIAAAVFPPAIVFALLLLCDDSKTKIKVLRASIALVIFLVATIGASVYIGFENSWTYFKATFAIPADPVLGNISIQNSLALIGLKNIPLRYMVTILTSAIILLGMFILPSQWQKASAALCLMLGLMPSEKNIILIFAFVPFVLLLAENAHRSTDWLYLLAFSLFITPMPEWTYFSSESFKELLSLLNLPSTNCINELVSPLAMIVLTTGIIIQTVQIIKKKLDVQGQ